MELLETITILIINYRTLDLTCQCLASLRRFYPQVRLLLIDNGSADASSQHIADFAHQDKYTTCILNRRNRFHGPALDQGLHSCQTALVLTLDSDCTVIQGGFIEEMAAFFRRPETYAAGEQVQMDRFGYEVPTGFPGSCPYIHPRCMLIERDTYLRLRRFTHHGAPCLRNMKEAIQTGYVLCDFPVGQYVHHLGRGTCGKYGYHLGLRHKIEHLLHQALCRSAGEEFTLRQTPTDKSHPQASNPQS